MIGLPTINLISDIKGRKVAFGVSTVFIIIGSTLLFVGGIL